MKILISLSSQVEVPNTKLRSSVSVAAAAAAAVVCARTPAAVAAAVVVQLVVGYWAHFAVLVVVVAAAEEGLDCWLLVVAEQVVVEVVDFAVGQLVGPGCQWVGC